MWTVIIFKYLDNVFCLSPISAENIQHLIQSPHSRTRRFLVSSHCQNPARKTKGLVLQSTNQIGTGLQSFERAHLHFLCNIYLGRYLEPLLSGLCAYLNRVIYWPRTMMTYANTGLSVYFGLVFVRMLSSLESTAQRWKTHQLGLSSCALQINNTETFDFLTPQAAIWPHTRNTKTNNYRKGSAQRVLLCLHRTTWGLQR